MKEIYFDQSLTDDSAVPAWYSSKNIDASLAVWDRAFVRMIQERCPLNARPLSGCCKNLVPDWQESPEVLERLQKRGIQTFRTDLQGDIAIYEQDGKLMYETGKNPDADVFVAGVIPVEDSGTPQPQELQLAGENDISEDESITRGDKIESAPEKHEMDYIVNVKTGKFHYPDCRGVRQMKESNKRYITCDRQELLDQGYESCGICYP